MKDYCKGCVYNTKTKKGCYLLTERITKYKCPFKMDRKKKEKCEADIMRYSGNGKW